VVFVVLGLDGFLAFGSVGLPPGRQIPLACGMWNLDGGLVDLDQTRDGVAQPVYNSTFVTRPDHLATIAC
jgi:hypothetical protein